jgi:Holliday junction resolvasome RuvABC endonuclease subunit
VKILALDLGTTTGWAYSGGVGNSLNDSGIWSLAPSRHESSGMRWIKFRQSLRRFENMVDIVLYEEVARHLGTHAAHIYGGFVAILQDWCQENNIEYQGIPVATIKKFATGKGNASKQMMIDHARNILRREPVDDNEADAVCLMNHAEYEYHHDRKPYSTTDWIPGENTKPQPEKKE